MTTLLYIPAWHAALWSLGYCAVGFAVGWVIRAVTATPIIPALAVLRCGHRGTDCSRCGVCAECYDRSGLRYTACPHPPSDDCPTCLRCTVCAEAAGV